MSQDTSGTSKPSATVSKLDKSETPRAAKPRAEDKTINFLTGKTALEEAEEARRIAEAADIQEGPKERTPLKPNEERANWEAKGTVRLKGIIQGFRISETSDGGYLLERMSVMPGGDPHFYGVFSFPRELMVELKKAVEEVDCGSA